MRKNFVWGVILFAVLAACDRKKAVSPVDYTEDSAADSLVEPSDSSFFSVDPQDDDELPQEVDELFDDFIFEFSRRKKLQLARVQFPLPMVEGGDTVWIPKEKWDFEPLFVHQDYYTVFYNKEEQMELEKSTSLKSVEVDQIQLDRRRIRTCRFERLDGEWKLTLRMVRDYSDHNPLDCFLDFYQKFATDKDFQRQSLDNPIRYITTNPDDDFDVIEGTLDAEQWDAFKPQIPSGVITNIHYGQTYDDPDEMILVKAGISNGLMNILYFAKRHGKWKLVGYEN